MANESRSDTPSGPGGDRERDTTASQARESLTLLDADGARLADRLITPWWYHVTLGAIGALIMGAQALPGSASATGIAVGAVALVLLPAVYRRRYGVSVTAPAGPRSRRLMGLLLGIYAVAFVAAFSFRLNDLDPRFVVLPAALVLALSIVVGRRYDDALRVELARRDEPRR